MKLILNGGGVGDSVISARQRLNELIDHTKKCLYVPLAWPDKTFYGCLEFITNELKDVDIPGIDMIKSGEELYNKNFNDYSFIYIGGGNTFSLLKDLKDSGSFEKIKEYLKNNGIVYGGSAGAIIFGHDLDSCIIEDANEVELKDIYGFDMLNGYSLLCHFTNRNEIITKKSKEYLLKLSKQKPIYAIPEEDTIYVSETGIEFFGTRPYYIFEHGNIQKVNLVKN